MAAGFKKSQVVAAKVPSTQSNYPSYVDLSRLGITTIAEANSVRVYADADKIVELPRQILSATVMFVKVTSFTSTVFLYVDFDGVRADYGVTTTYGRNAVWADYVAVLHLGGTVDSTGNGNTLTDTGVTTTPGKIGDANVYNGGGVTSNSQFATNTFKYTTQDFTISLWVRFTNAIGAGEIIFNNYAFPGSNQGYSMTRRDSGKMAFDCRVAGVANTIVGDVNILQNVWYKTVFKKGTGANQHRQFLNNVAQGQRTTGTIGYAATHYPGLGVSRYASSLYFQAATSRNATLKIREWLEPDDWTTLEYKNENDEATFWGAWTDAGVIPAQPARQGAVMMM